MEPTQKNVLTWHSLSCAVPFPTTSKASSTQEDKSGEREGKGTAQHNALAALWVPKTRLIHKGKCTNVVDPMQTETEYRGRQCHNLYHFGCIGTQQGEHQKQVKPIKKGRTVNKDTQTEGQVSGGSRAGALNTRVSLRAPSKERELESKGKHSMHSLSGAVPLPSPSPLSFPALWRDRCHLTLRVINCILKSVIPKFSQ